MNASASESSASKNPVDHRPQAEVIYRLRREGKFPRVIKVIPFSSAWVYEEVQEYLRLRSELRDKPS
jgi:hypothetical protein